MATSGLTCVVRRSFSKFTQLQKSTLLGRKIQKPPAPVLIQSVLCPCSSFCTTVLHRSEVNVEYRDGLSVFSVPLPSRKESCEFVLKPVSHTVKDFVRFLQEEDKGIDRAAIYTDDGSRVANSTTIDILLRSNFTLKINEDSYSIRVPSQLLPLPSEEIDRMSEVKNMVAKLYSQLNVEEHQLKRENEIMQRLEEYRRQIAPMEKVKLDFEEKIVKRNTLWAYGFSTMMGIQCGFFARLTWWEYSWDVMEPVTYFATYVAIMGMYAYFVITSMEYNYVDAWDREFLRKFHKMAQKHGFDVEKYNELVRLIQEAESDLKRLRDPLQVHLPIREL